LQPLNLAVNKPLKDQMKKQYDHWCAGEVKKKLRATGNDSSKIVDLKLARIPMAGGCL